MPNADQPANSNGATKRKVASPSKTTARITGRTTRSAPPKPNLRAEIERRAYEFWEAEGRPAGREQSHWYRAEQEVAQARTRTPKRTPASTMSS